MTALNTYVFGGGSAESTPTVLAIHGLTGHGRRWEPLARHLGGVRIVAPDLIGHGRSPWRPPWSIEHHVRALSAVLDEHVPDGRPIVVAGHSFGGALALHLANRRPDAVKGLVLLDPAQGLDPEFALEVATDSLDNWDYANVDAARAAKKSEGWADVPDDIMEAELTEHLIPRPHGQVGWRVSAPAAAASWSEMARPAVLPPPGVPTHIVVADQVQPPFVRPAFLEACASERGGDVTVHHADCAHMVPFLEPELTATLIRSLL
ncbi:alpha/beta hydrolase [Gordonia amicalis]|uniref:Alpha/beta fold hydrolase n=1 Tax=Gordonia amicalis TaxID=89053 RepID=A0AAE4R3P7_9ACTN|nr:MULTISPECIES: alpha/beta fold hydrolase [Gordonia]ATD71807.1 alpha/beta hydrolase [Gordonia sp. 1D]MDV6311113.1 alpha/beta fold hydrolase [Gordonia amicalis]MDV7101981.1 alpha/beta fold hydrolase [Gordonia amicalis]UPW15556.1 alpha/beta hydrolase [Gordonia amicalis]